MCLAKAYLSENGQKKLILEDVALLQIEEEKLYLRTLFGEQREMKAIVREVDFHNSNIILTNPA